MSERLARAKAAADKFIAACVAPGTLKGYKKEWVKWLTQMEVCRDGEAICPRQREIQEEFECSLFSIGVYVWASSVLMQCICVFDVARGVYSLAD
jgi:hypothetical protein